MFLQVAIGRFYKFSVESTTRIAILELATDRYVDTMRPGAKPWSVSIVRRQWKAKEKISMTWRTKLVRSVIVAATLMVAMIGTGVAYASPARVSDTQLTTGTLVHSAMPASPVCTNIIWKTLADTGTIPGQFVWQDKTSSAVETFMKLVRYGAYDSSNTNYYCSYSKAPAWVKCNSGRYCYPGYFLVQLSDANKNFQFGNPTLNANTVSATTPQIAVSTSTRAKLWYTDSNGNPAYIQA